MSESMEAVGRRIVHAMQRDKQLRQISDIWRSKVVSEKVSNGIPEDGDKLANWAVRQGIRFFDVSHEFTEAAQALSDTKLTREQLIQLAEKMDDKDHIRGGDGTEREIIFSNLRKAIDKICPA
jgi:hypothetical protein